MSDEGTPFKRRNNCVHISLGPRVRSTVTAYEQDHVLFIVIYYDMFKLKIGSERGPQSARLLHRLALKTSAVLMEARIRKKVKQTKR